LWQILVLDLEFCGHSLHECVFLQREVLDLLGELMRKHYIYENYEQTLSLGMKVIGDKRNITDIDNKASQVMAYKASFTMNFIAVTIRQCLKLSSSASETYRTNSLTNRYFYCTNHWLSWLNFPLPIHHFGPLSYT
jgi:hypothetical protein